MRGLAPFVPYVTLQHTVSEITLRITVSEDPESMTVRLDGRVTGAWVNECDRACRSILASLGSKKLRVDLRGVTHVDASGRRLLGEIHQRAGATFLADTPMTKYFAQEAQGQNQNGTKEEE